MKGDVTSTFYIKFVEKRSLTAEFLRSVICDKRVAGNLVVTFYYISVNKLTRKNFIPEIKSRKPIRGR
mgnify:CR=1 FL=1